MANLATRLNDARHKASAQNAGTDITDVLLDAMNLVSEVAALVECRAADHGGRTECFEAMEPHLRELAERIR